MKSRTPVRTVVASLCAGLAAALVAQSQQQASRPQDTEVWTPVPPVVTPGEAGAPPSDATVLIGRDGLGAWHDSKGGEAKWDFADGVATVKQGAGDIVTKASFGSCQVHLEWRTPAVVKGDGQGRGNSGLFFMDQYELQILDSYENKTYVNGQAASIYKQYAPLVNASKKPGEWQTYDAVFHAPAFGADGKVQKPASITVLHNGVLVLDNVQIKGETVYSGRPEYHAHPPQMPFHIQNHGNPVSFRNMWVREL
ncbi:MAG: DUF1080 domain-containing protein [Fimbriimonadaceae bacterium]|nr:DUF1080 domain-containing protein [Fimbriimonadaceae bacterium]